MIRELVQNEGMTELTRESTKREILAVIAYQKLELRRVSVDVATVTIHTGWYVNCT